MVAQSHGHTVIWSRNPHGLTLTFFVQHHKIIADWSARIPFFWNHVGASVILFPEAWSLKPEAWSLKPELAHGGLADIWVKKKKMVDRLEINWWWMRSRSLTLVRAGVLCWLLLNYRSPYRWHTSCVKNKTENQKIFITGQIKDNLYQVFSRYTRCK